MLLRWVISFAAILCFSGGYAFAQTDENVSIGDLKVRLWYEATGRLSEDVSAPDFPLWNSIIGEGGAEEPANDVLVTVEVVGSGGQQNVTTPLLVTLDRDDQNSMTFVSDGLFIDSNGRTTKGFWIQDLTCAGPVKITARIGTQTKTLSVNFDCGE